MCQLKGWPWSLRMLYKLKGAVPNMWQKIYFRFSFRRNSFIYKEAEVQVSETYLALFPSCNFLCIYIKLIVRLIAVKESVKPLMKCSGLCVADWLFICAYVIESQRKSMKLMQAIPHTWYHVRSLDSDLDSFFVALLTIMKTFLSIKTSMNLFCIWVISCMIWQIWVSGK